MAVKIAYKGQQAKVVCDTLIPVGYRDEVSEEYAAKLKEKLGDELEVGAAKAAPVEAKAEAPVEAPKSAKRGKSEE